MDRDRNPRFVLVHRGRVPTSILEADATTRTSGNEADFVLLHSGESRDHYRDRDRDRDREYDRDRDVEKMGRGESYRPGRSLRSPVRDRGREGDGFRRGPPSDTYMPGSTRRPRSRSPRRSPPSYRRRSRSRTPPRRYADDHGHRARSPPKRGYSPRRDGDRRDTRMRSPAPRDTGRYDRSPPRYRERSPAPAKRARDPSPYSRERGFRSPPARRERFGSPRRHERYVPT